MAAPADSAFARRSTIGENTDSTSSTLEVEPPPLLVPAPARRHADRFTQEFGQQFAERFKSEAPALAPTPRKLTKFELIESVFPEVVRYLQAGYSHDAIAAHLTGLGVPIRTSTLKSYVLRIRASQRGGLQSDSNRASSR